MVRVLHIAREEHSFPAGVLYQFFSLLGVIVLAEIGDQYVGTLARVGDRNCSANATVCASDDRLLVCESTAAAVAALAVVGHRFHHVRFAGHWLFLLGKGGLRMRTHGVGTLGSSNELLRQILNGRLRSKFRMLRGCRSPCKGTGSAAFGSRVGSTTLANERVLLSLAS